MKTLLHFSTIVLIVFTVLMIYGAKNTASAQITTKPYDLPAMYDESKPDPPKITPPTSSTQEAPGKPPSDAIILFDGKDVSKWVDSKGNPSKWIVANGYMESVKGAGQIMTKEGFGSCQLHVEWATPTVITGKSQGRGNSGVFLMNQYEIQVLDSWDNKTYPPGMAASVYSQSPPLVNASLAPGQWQTYDIVFHRPIFENGKVVKPATVTVFYNGVLVQDNFEIMGTTDYKKIPQYKPHGDKLPVALQDHNNPVRFRNIWIRPLEQ
ncbi:MAG: DUF1080 domain-containing protein [Patescibacteria group bacterium]|nr:DUF1080 domain-containing protein [Patescibacteria group bacterium]